MLFRKFTNKTFCVNARNRITYFSVVPKIANAIKAEFNPVGFNLLNNNGEKAGQTVFHFHLHLIPRYGENDGFGAVWKSHQNEYTMENLQNIASTIANSVK